MAVSRRARSNAEASARRWGRRRATALVVPATLALVGGGAIAYAAIPAADGTIGVCYVPAVSVRFVDGASDCHPGGPGEPAEAFLKINQQGPQGVQGPQGTQGAPGAQGLAGTQGSPGATGSQGAKGDAGVTGAAGAKGDVGAKGDAGAPGGLGAPGPQGQKGDPGAPGQPGEQGVPGAAGAGARFVSLSKWTASDLRSSKQITVRCPPGQMAIAGGAHLRHPASIAGPVPLAIAQSRPYPETSARPVGWVAAANTTSPYARRWSVQVSVTCAA
jgi:hypothetical protein